MVMLVGSWRAIRGESEQPMGTDFSQNSRPFFILKTPMWATRNSCFSLVTNEKQTMWGYLHPQIACFSLVTASPMQCLFFMGHGLHPCIVCSPLVTAYTHGLFFFLVSILLLFSTAGWICQQHPPGSLQFKVIYYNNNKRWLQIIKVNCVKNKQLSINKIAFNSGTNILNIFNN